MALIFKALGLCLALGFASIASMLWIYSKDLPSYEQLAQYKHVQVTRVYSSDLKLLGEYGVEKRTFIPISSIPELVKKAFVASEDKTFYQHCGVDFIGILRASMQAVPALLRGKQIKGASTITQQVAKNLLLSPRKTLERKVKEIMLALILSRRFSKDQVLELYLNHVYFGYGAYGIASASRAYFDKPVEELNVVEIAFLAGILTSPSGCDPLRNYGRAKARRNYALCRMYEDKLIGQAQLDESLQAEITIKKQSRLNRVYAPYYLDRVQDLAMRLVDKEAFYTGGLTIVTSLDPNLQEKANKALAEGIIAYEKRRPYRGPIGHIKGKDWKVELAGVEKSFPLSSEIKAGVILANASTSFLVGLSDGKTTNLEFGAFKFSKGLKDLKVGDIVALVRSGSAYHLIQVPECNGALMAIKPASGRVVAMVGGFDYTASQFDRATQAKRQIGSLAKIFVYLAALEKNIEPNTIFPDEPIEVLLGNERIWSPRNNRGKFLGPITMRTAFERSCNSVTVRVAQEIGMDAVVSTLERFGVCHNVPPNPSVVLGSAESTLARVVNACGMLVNGGYRLQPCFIEYIQDSSGKIIYRAPDSCFMQASSDGTEFASFEPPPERIVDEASAYQIVSMMIGAAKRGTARSFGNAFNQIVGGKTGTTNGCCDAWFIGFSRDIVAGCYVGHDVPKSLGAYEEGSTVALLPVKTFLSDVLSGKTTAHFKVPSNIRLENVDPATGMPTEGDFGLVEALKVIPSLPASQIPSSPAPDEEELKILDADVEEGNDE